MKKLARVETSIATIWRALEALELSRKKVDPVEKATFEKNK
jgi:hypothetical protein